MCITRRGVGMTLAATLFWLAMAGVAAFAGLDAAVLGMFFVVGAALVYPGGYALNRVLGGDLGARGSAFRGMVGAITLGQFLGAPLIVALLLRDAALVAFALATTLGLASAPVAALLQAAVPLQANVAIPLAMAALYLGASIHVLGQNRREGASTRTQSTA